jgi:nucleotide exchange factor SIL1
VEGKAAVYLRSSHLSALSQALLVMRISYTIRFASYVKMSSTRLNALFAYICLLLLCSSAYANAPAPAHSPKANTVLICHTSHASECYPAIFQPTEYFQQIHDDQSIPPGLHVRLNLATGLKEARLNVPEAEDAPKADLVIIDNTAQLPNDWEQAPYLDRSQKVLEDQNREWQETAPSKSGLDDSFAPGDVSDKSNYLLAQKTVLGSSNVQSTLSAMEFLTGLSHDLEWGIALARNADLSRTLVEYINPQSGVPIKVRSASAQLLATAVQNNAEALAALLACYTEAEQSQYTPTRVVHTALKTSMTRENPDTIFQSRLLFLLTNLAPSLAQLQAFVSDGGLTTLLDLFVSMEVEPSADGQGRIRMKIANYLQDHIISTIDGWPGHSLLKMFSPGKSSEVSDSQLVWNEAMKGMKAWCNALEIAFERYDIAQSSGGASIDAVNEHRSIYEAHEMLESVLRYHGCKGGCGCDVGKT